MRALQCIFGFVWNIGTYLREKVEAAVSDFSVSGGNRGNAFMKRDKWMKGSMTVEASYVMLIVLFLLLFLIRHSFFLHDIVVGSASLHRAVEIERRVEADTIGSRKESDKEYSKENDREANREDNKKREKNDEKYSTGFLFAEDAQISVKKGILACEGELQAGEWKKQISVKMFYPEEYMRAAAAFFPETGRK